MLQCVAGCCRVLQSIVDVRDSTDRIGLCCSVLQFVAVCCSLLQCAAVCCSVLQFVAVCCSVLQFVERDSTHRRALYRQRKLTKHK